MECLTCRSGLDREKKPLMAAVFLLVRCVLRTSRSHRRGSADSALAEEPCSFAVKTAPTVPVECLTCGSGLDREKGPLMAAAFLLVRCVLRTSLSHRRGSAERRASRGAVLLRGQDRSYGSGGMLDLWERS